MILTKIDGDARGGAALSVKEVTGRPILFAGTGEKLDDFEPFHPDRMASRILGMGDVLTLIEKAEARPSTRTRPQGRARSSARASSPWTTSSSRCSRCKKMGPLQDIIGMIPGLPKELKQAQIDDERAREGRGHHPLDDARRSATTRRSSTVRGGCASPRGAAPTPRT